MDQYDKHGNMSKAEHEYWEAKAEAADKCPACIGYRYAHDWKCPLNQTATA